MIETAISKLDAYPVDENPYEVLAPPAAIIGLFLVCKSLYMNDFGSFVSVLAAAGVTMIGAGYLLSVAKKFIVLAEKEGASGAKAPDSSESKDMVDQEKLDRVRKNKERREQDKKES